MKTFEKVTALFQSTALAIAIANQFDLAYHTGVGAPEGHTPFTIDDAESVAINLAGLYAADTAANSIAALTSGLEDGLVTEDNYLAALELIADGNLDDVAKYIALQSANLAWRAGQPFRGLSSKPLDRITRGVNQQFNLLPPDEIDKDLVQVQKGAKLLLLYINTGSIDS